MCCVSPAVARGFACACTLWCIMSSARQQLKLERAKFALGCIAGAPVDAASITTASELPFNDESECHSPKAAMQATPRGHTDQGFDRAALDANGSASEAVYTWLQPGDSEQLSGVFFQLLQVQPSQHLFSQGHLALSQTTCMLHHTCCNLVSAPSQLPPSLGCHVLLSASSVSTRLWHTGAAG